MDAAEALFLGLAYSIFPDGVVYRMTIWDAASHTSARSSCCGVRDRAAVYRRIHGVFVPRVPRQGTRSVVLLSPARTEHQEILIGQKAVLFA